MKKNEGDNMELFRAVKNAFLPSALFWMGMYLVIKLLVVLIK